MQIALKWVYQLVKVKGKQKIEAGQKPSLCFRGRTHMLCVSVGHPVRVIKRPVRDFDVLRTVMNGTKEYTVQDAVDKLREIAARNGITIGASKLLDRAVSQAATIEDEDQFNDEEDTMETAKAETADLGAEAEANSATPADESTKETKKDTDMKTQSNSKSNSKSKSKSKAAKPANGKPVKAAKPVKAKAAKPVKAAKPANGKPRGKYDFEGKILPFIAAEFKKLEDPKKPPYGWGKMMYGKIAEKFGMSINTADQMFWKAKWEHAKDLGIK